MWLTQAGKVSLALAGKAWQSLGTKLTPRLIVQTDSLGVVEIMMEGDNSTGVAIYEDYIFLYSGFSNVKFDYCLRRPINQSMFQLIAEGSFPILWEQGPPSFILAQLADNVTIV